MSRKQGQRVAPSRTGRLLKVTWGGIITDNTVTFYINDTLSKHSVGDIVYKPLLKVTEHEYLLPLDGQTIDGMTYKRLVDYLGTNVLPNLNGRYLRADTTPGTMVEAGLPNIKESPTLHVHWNNYKGQYTVEPESGSKLFQKGPATETSSYPNASDETSGYYPSDMSLGIDASQLNPIYGNSDTVTPLTYTVRAYICYA